MSTVGWLILSALAGSFGFTVGWALRSVCMFERVEEER